MTVCVKDRCILVQSENPLTTLGSGIMGGLNRTKTIVSMQIPHGWRGTLEDLKERAAQAGIEECVGILTTSDVTKCAFTENRDVLCICTAGKSDSAIILIVDFALNLQEMVDVLISASEAKTVAFHDLDVRESVCEFASQHVSSSVVVACTGDGETLSRRADFRFIYETVRESVLEVLRKEFPPERTVRERLSERGIRIEDLVEAEMEMFIENDAISREKFRILFEEKLHSTLKDINISSLILGALRLEEDGRKGLIPSLSKDEFVRDPIHLVSDEILGTAVAQYIGGTLAVFEFSRIERAKPGILRKMGPFLDDILGGLLAGVSSRIFSELSGGEVKDEAS